MTLCGVFRFIETSAPASSSVRSCSAPVAITSSPSCGARRGLGYPEKVILFEKHLASSQAARVAARQSGFGWVGPPGVTGGLSPK